MTTTALLDATMALSVLERERATATTPLLYDAAVTRLRDVVHNRAQPAATTRAASATHRARKAIGETLDFLDSIRRRRMAASVVDDLACGRISHATAAARMRQIVARTMGAWMLDPS